MVTEGAYGRLKGRWRVLMRKCESRKSTTKKMTLACTVLHNLCINMDDPSAPHWHEEFEKISAISCKIVEPLRKSKVFAPPSPHCNVDWKQT